MKIVMLLAVCGLCAAQDAKLEQLRNLGKAFYENPTTQKEAVTTLKQALDLAPKSARERLNYGLALLRAARGPEGIAELLRVQKEQPALPHTWFTLAIEYKKQGETAKALEQIRGAVKIDPKEPMIQYNLGAVLKQSGDNAGAIAAFEKASALDSNLAGARFQLFNLYRQAGKAKEAQTQLAAFQALKKQTEGAAVPEDVDWCQYSEIYDPKPVPPARDLTPVKWQPKKVADRWLGAMAFGDQVLYWDGSGPSLGGKRIAVVSGTLNVAAGDYDNDGLVDLCVVGSTSAVLLKNTTGGWKLIPLPVSGGFNKCVFMDYDHDYDLDLVLLGERQVLLRNQGSEGFKDKTEDFPFAGGTAVDAVVTRMIPDTRGFDLIVSYVEGGGALYRDLLLGKYARETLEILPSGAKGLSAGDVNQDSVPDLVYSVGDAVMLSLGGKPGVAVKGIRGRGVIADLHNDGRLEVVAGVAAVDLNGDGKTDIVEESAGSWTEKLNVTPGLNKWLRISLEGVKNLKTAPGAEIELRVGGLYQKKAYDGFPLRFGLGKAAAVEVVRITWPNGLIQNEMKQAAGPGLKYKEAQRLSGSCPIVWSWNGREFEYITDVLGVAPLGASAGDGTFFPTDHDEYIAVSGEQLKANAEGMLEMRLTEELSEAAYFDQVRLLAVDHAEGTRVLSNEKWKGPPFPEFRLYGVKEAIHAVKATDERGQDVTGLLAARDRTYPNSFERTAAGAAKKHALTLDFGKAAVKNDAILVLHGWVDWADGSTFIASAQEGKPLESPVLQVKNKRGEWVTAIDDMGMPSGKPKTIVVNLKGKFLSANREVRIVTNLCVYWDEIYLGESSAEPETRVTALSAAGASLQFRGFSPSTIHPERKQPEEFTYANPEPVSLWNPTPGMYTRYGEVTALTRDLDDKLVVMGSGDELRLQFAAAGLPALKPGWRRDYLLHVDGWAKDRDANTAYSQSVSPLPFHEMGSYPYRLDKVKAPGGDWQREYNTRPALRLLRPLR